MPYQCLHHKELQPTVIHFGQNKKFGTQQYACAVCSRVREFGKGEIAFLKNGTGKIFTNTNKNIFFSLEDFNDSFKPKIGTKVSFELGFFNSMVKAVDIRPIKQGGIK